MNCSDTLSRLKGIETRSEQSEWLLLYLFRYAFPFEGNWNRMRIICQGVIPVGFRYAFPFEGNWNPSGIITKQFKETGSDTLSRLKGIETETIRNYSDFRRIMVQIRFPVWRELKRNLTHSWHQWFSDGSDTLSRLKGIETLLGRTKIWPSSSFRYAFPFEGNWNADFLISATFVTSVQIRFPVWRELKLWRRSGTDWHTRWVQIRFPVWRELKLQNRKRRPNPEDEFRYAFPFEGNWNSTVEVWTKCSRKASSDTLSRLKGIETLSNPIHYLQHQNGQFRYAFPFEGNWNNNPYRMGFPKNFGVQIRFPVWRELKRRTSDRPNKLMSVQIRFPVWRELKQSIGL